MSKAALTDLEHKLDELILVCERLTEDNQRLRAEQDTLKAERNALLEKTSQARSRIESMIERLKLLENEA